ncbi:hypothetical protein AC1031_011936 [Aphanomyces cochlioides]|nr:hypothetical protein AC1031_011936 [Aphanomyces cochlioides]
MPVDVTERALKKRLYFREKKRMQRKELRDEALYLKNRVSELEAVLMAVQPPSRSRVPDDDDNTMLTWKEIARALSETSNETLAQQQTLTVQTQSLRKRIADMQRWMQVNMTYHPQIIGGMANWTWRNVTLFADPEIRALGKTWITEHMYHNTEAMFKSHEFPSIEEQLYAIDFSHDGTSIVHRSQTEMGIPASLLLQIYRRHFCEALMIDGVRTPNVSTLKETSGSTALHQVISNHAAGPEFANLLVGEFPDAETGRTVVVVRQIMEDEASNHKYRQRNRMVWYGSHRQKVVADYFY